MNDKQSFECLFILFLCGSLLNAQSHLHNNNIIFNKSDVNPFPEKCSSILEVFAEYAANFTYCTIKNSRPIKLCENCVDQYVNFHLQYNELKNTTVNGTSCLSLFISQDRLDAVLEYHDHISTVWNKGQCNDCFDWTEAMNPKRSNNTLQFNKMVNETMQCIVDNYDPLSNSTEKVCVTCMQSYTKLDEYYKSLSEDSIGVDSICMDIVDSMNTTRSIWSKNLNCCNLRKSPEIVFLCCTGIISLFPVLFYLAVKYCGPIRDLPNVLKETRFKQSILRTMQGRIN